MKPNARPSVVVATALVFALFALFTPALAWADTLIVELTKTGENESTSQTWLGPDRLAVVSDEMTMIYRGDLKKLYVVQHAQKTTLVADLPFDLTSIMPPQMAQMMDQMVPEVTVTPTEETREIAGYTATRYDMEIKMPMGMTIESTSWVSKEAPIDWTLARKMTDEITTSMSPQMKGVIEKMSSIEGYQLGSESTQNLMGQMITTTKMVQSIEDKDAPEGTYDPPADYEQKPFSIQNMMGQGQ
jgi:hypothetical protein